MAPSGLTVDDGEAHYCKVLGDEIFGRGNFLANVIWEKADSPRVDAEFFSARHDHILVFAKNKTACKINKMLANEEGPARHYDKVHDMGRPYYLKPLRAMGGEDSRSARPTLFFPLTAPDGSIVLPIRKDGTEGRWRWSKERMETDKHLIEWICGRSGWAPYYRIYGDVESYARLRPSGLILKLEATEHPRRRSKLCLMELKLSTLRSQKN